MQRDPSLPPEPLPLTEASVQEIQLELIRRNQFNAFDGRKIAASLRRHRSLWETVLMDRPGFMNHDGRSFSGLIKLRDLSANTWNVDYLSFRPNCTIPFVKITLSASKKCGEKKNTNAGKINPRWTNLAFISFRQRCPCDSCMVVRHCD